MVDEILLYEPFLAALGITKTFGLVLRKQLVCKAGLYLEWD